MDKKYIIIKRMSLISNIILLTAMVCLLGYYIWYLIDLNNYESGELSKGAALAILVFNIFSPFLIAGLLLVIVLIVIGIAKINKDISKSFNLAAAIMFFIGAMIVISANIDTLKKGLDVDIPMFVLGIIAFVFAIFNGIIQILRYKSMNTDENINNKH
ncbi:MAG: hypothetical protein J5666_05980 [Bacilli bacterium]|nr:hypothetical protein [Bacilli bacterium]